MHKVTAKVIEAFVAGRKASGPRNQDGHRSIHTDGATVWSYDTVLAIRVAYPDGDGDGDGDGDMTIVLNMTRYSRETSHSRTIAEKQRALDAAFGGYAWRLGRLPIGASVGDLARAARVFPAGLSDAEGGVHLARRVAP